MKRIIWNTCVVIYAIIAIFVTICLLSYNKYKISEFKDISLVIIENRELEPEFNKGDLVIADRSYKLEKGEKVFFYDTSNPVVTIKVAEIIDMQEVTQGDITYTLEGNLIVKSEEIIGPANKITQISKVGTILGILESKWGFLALIVFPSLIAFLYEISELFSEIKNSSKKKE